MQFFDLTHPRYVDDRELAMQNPIIMTADHHIPGIACASCGLWSSSARIRRRLPAKSTEFAGMTFLPASDWMRTRPRWARVLKIDENAIQPGAVLGPPTGTCRAPVRNDFVHPRPGVVWCNRRARDTLAKARLSGVSFAAVRITSARVQPHLYELVVQGHAWRVGSSPKKIRACNICGRTRFPRPSTLAVDESRWDGGDIFHVDNNPNIVVVTERVHKVLAHGRFTNVLARPISRPRKSG